jgi:hypothetical protein
MARCCAPTAAWSDTAPSLDTHQAKERNFATKPGDAATNPGIPQNCDGTVVKSAGAARPNFPRTGNPSCRSRSFPGREKILGTKSRLGGRDRDTTGRRASAGDPARRRSGPARSSLASLRPWEGGTAAGPEILPDAFVRRTRSRAWRGSRAKGVTPRYSPKANTKGASTDETTGPWYSAPPAYEHRPPRQGGHRRSALPAASQQLAVPPMHSSHGTKSGSRSGLRTRVPVAVSIIRSLGLGRLPVPLHFSQIISFPAVAAWAFPPRRRRHHRRHHGIRHSPFGECLGVTPTERGL